MISFESVASRAFSLSVAHAIRFTTHEKAHYLAIDHTDVLQIQNDVAVVRLEFKEPPQFRYRLCFESATQDEHCESRSRRSLNPEVIDQAI